MYSDSYPLCIGIVAVPILQAGKGLGKVKARARAAAVAVAVLVGGGGVQGRSGSREWVTLALLGTRTSSTRGPWNSVLVVRPQGRGDDDEWSLHACIFCGLWVSARVPLARWLQAGEWLEKNVNSALSPPWGCAGLRDKTTDDALPMGGRRHSV
jgi:hypothetical protein